MDSNENFLIKCRTISSNKTKKEFNASTRGYNGAFRVTVNPLERGERSKIAVHVTGWKRANGALEIRVGQYDTDNNKEIGEQLVFETVADIDVEAWSDNPEDLRHRRKHKYEYPRKQGKSD